MYKKRIGLIFGGRSEEHEVSLKSAASVARALNSDKFVPVYIGITRSGSWKIYKGKIAHIEDGTWQQSAESVAIDDLPRLIDFALPILHGPYGEDGCVQGLLEMLNIPYGGCGVLASALAMDKQMFKEVMKQKGFSVCRDCYLSAGESGEEAEGIGFPCFVKPANMGSSVGITKAKNKEQLKEAVKLASSYDRRIIVEEFIDCREIEVAVISGRASVAGEIIPCEEFYDYSAKYDSKDTPSQLKIPADLSKEESDLLRQLAVNAYEAIDGWGFARVDFFKDKKSGKIYLNEINTIPGFTDKSMFPMLWQESGVSYSEIIERIIDSGYERHNAKNNRNADI